MALTATAPEKVQADIKGVLGLKNCVQIQQSFNRPNLYYEVRPKLKKVMNDIASFIEVQPPGASGIIYCSSREKCEVLAKELRDNHNIQAWHYHAGMSKGDRRKVQEGWQDHKFAVIVATVRSMALTTHT
jgi:bloom syndrome protein